MAMCDKAVSHGRGAQTSDCAPAHGACALCITKGAIWRKNGLNLGASRMNLGPLDLCACDHLLDNTNEAGYHFMGIII